VIEHRLRAAEVDPKPVLAAVGEVRDRGHVDHGLGQLGAEHVLRGALADVVLEHHDDEDDRPGRPFDES